MILFESERGPYKLVTYSISVFNKSVICAFVGQSHASIWFFNKILLTIDWYVFKRNWRWFEKAYHFIHIAWNPD